MCVYVFVCLCVWSACSGVEEPELVLSLHQSTIKQETEDAAGTERQTQSQEAATRTHEDMEEEEKSEEESALQADADVTLDFTNAGEHVSVNKNSRV